MCLPGNRKITNQDRVETLGTGMARRAGETVKNHPEYVRYAAEAQMNGEAPMSPEEWARTRTSKK